MRRYSEGVLKSVPADVGGREFERPQVEKVLSMLDRVDRVVLTGDKGSGKTVILCRLYREMTGNRRVMLVRCDDFLGCGSVDDLDMALGSGVPISDYLSGMRDGPKTVLLFDSLDAVSRNAESMSMFQQLIRRLWSIDNVQTVCSVRTYDYEYSPAIASVEWGARVAVGDLPEDVLDDALERIGNRTVPGKLRSILRNPLRLRIFHTIASKNPGANFAEVRSEVRLYQEHWKECVDRSGRRDAVAAALLGVAAQMVASRRTAVLRHAVAVPPDGLDIACSSGILEVSGDYVRFFHHAYLDHVAAMHVLRGYPCILDFLERNEYNVFFRPALASALSQLRYLGKAEYLGAVLSICRSGLKHYWKISALESLAAADGFSEGEMEPIGHLLTVDPILQCHFLAGAARARNPFWLRLWSDTVIEEWAASGPNAEPVADYIRSLSVHREHHGEMIRLVSLLVSNGKTRPMACERIVAMTAGMSVLGKSSWYEELSLDRNAWVRAGVLHCLWGLLDTDPDAAATVFRNVATYGEAPSAWRPPRRRAAHPNHPSRPAAASKKTGARP